MSVLTSNISGVEKFCDSVSRTLKNHPLSVDKAHHGIIQSKNLLGDIEYSLVREKQQPLRDLFVLKEKSKNPDFTNLTNELERVCYNGVEFETLFKERPELSRTVGSLPQQWGRIIGKSEEKREQIDNLFSEFSKEFHSKVTGPDSVAEIDTEPLQKGLSKVLGRNVEVSKLENGHGAWGQIYKINDGLQEYALKVYYDNLHNLNSSKYQCHGNYAELSSAVYASKNDADNYVTFYMGRFGENHDGYLLTKFLSDAKQDAKICNGMDVYSLDNFAFAAFIHKLKCGDLRTSGEAVNTKGKKIYDFGHCSASEASKLDNKTYQIAKTVGRCIDTNNAKDLDLTIREYGKTKEFQAAISFLQSIINRNVKPQNFKVLESKKDLLEKAGLDYMPDIRYILSLGKNYVKIRKALRPDVENYDSMLKIPSDAFEKLWIKYHELLGI